MKLRNKQTPDKLGEIVPYDAGKDGGIAIETDKGIVWYYHSLAELNKEWEDYEEPKGYYYVTTTGLIKYDDTPFCAIHKDRKAIGNYFETKEEAEQTVEKLKAWERLKDKGFRFEGWTIDDGLRISICTNTDEDDIYDDDKRRIKPDLDTCFGGEE